MFCGFERDKIFILCEETRTGVAQSVRASAATPRSIDSSKPPQCQPNPSSLRCWETNKLTKYETLMGITFWRPRITLHTTDLVVYLSSHESDCDMFPSFLRCLLMRIPLVASLTFVCTSNLMIAMERHVSTYKAKTYESNRSVGFLLVGLQAIIAGTLVFVMYSGTKFNLNTRLFYCLATAADHPFRTIAPISTLIILQFSAMIILKVTERENTKRSIEQRLNPDLKVRYNVGENLRTITIVIPFCYSCCFFTTLFTLVSCFVIFFNHIFEKPMYFALLEASLLLPVYSLMVPGLIRRMNRRVNQKNRSALQHHINSSKSVSVTSVYFDPSTWAWMNEREEEKTKKIVEENAQLRNNLLQLKAVSAFKKTLNATK
ncbi:hypothetical protein RB195_003656 [Necator americanus]|uniref:G protein-coupled receptor n=1 Tax=Necator americanus TaxID=51031 RepID=A0ABR1DSA2_NECAM